MPTFVYMTRCDGCGHCVDICPSDIMHIDKTYRRAYNIEPNMCWECYACVKACPQNAIDCLTVYCEEAVPDSERKTRRCIAALSKGDDLQVQLSAVRRFFKRNPMSIIDVGKRIADKVLEREVYSLV